MYRCSSRLGVKEKLPCGAFGIWLQTSKTNQYGFEGRLNHHRVRFLRGKIQSVLFHPFANKLHTTDLKWLPTRWAPDPVRAVGAHKPPLIYRGYLFHPNGTIYFRPFSEGKTWDSIVGVKVTPPLMEKKNGHQKYPSRKYFNHTSPPLQVLPKEYWRIDLHISPSPFSYYLTNLHFVNTTAVRECHTFYSPQVVAPKVLCF